MTRPTVAELVHARAFFEAYPDPIGPEWKAARVLIAELDAVTAELAAARETINRMAGEHQEAGECWRHKKRGTTYEIIGSATVQASLPPILLADGCPVLVYRCREDGALCVRRPTEFYDGRFERIDGLAQRPPTEQPPLAELDAVTAELAQARERINRMVAWYRERR